MKKSNTTKILELLDREDKNFNDLLEEFIIETKKNPFKNGELSEDFLNWKESKEKQVNK